MIRHKLVLSMSASALFAAVVMVDHSAEAFSETSATQGKGAIAGLERPAPPQPTSLADQIQRPGRQGSVFIYLYLPNMTSQPSQPQPDRGFGDSVSLSIAEQAPTLNITYVRIAPEREDGPLTEQYGLKSFRVVPGGKGFLDRSAIKEPDLVLFAHDEREVRTLIHCRMGDPFPSCEHHFHASAYAVKARYGMPHLSEWRSVEEGTRRLLNGMGVP